MNHFRLVWLPLLFCLTCTVSAVAAEAPKPEAPEPAALVDQVVVTHHKLKLGGTELSYTATTGHYVMKDEAGKAKAKMFFVAYSRDGIKDLGSRPVTFAFNGGPGAAALWVHLGAFGPKRVKLTAEGWPLPPPGTLVDNEHTLLDVSDLVFIDPVSTGFSRPAPGEDPKQFHGVQEDIASVADFIRLWTTRNGRWSSPKFIAGESYGTTRAAGLAGHLQDRHGMYLNGVVLISTILNWADQEFRVGNDLPYLIHLPSYAATAWYHRKLAPELQAQPLRAVLDEVESFVWGEYASALLQGDRLEPVRRRAVAERVAKYSGVSVEFVERCRLRLELFRYLKELLRVEGKTVGRLDSRFTGFDLDSAGESPEFDPSMAAVSIGYVALFNDYVRRELGYESDLPYQPLARVWPWNWGDDASNAYLNVAETLRGAMTRNPHLRVLFQSGYYDFATPYFDTVYSVAHLGLPAELGGNVETAFYEAGHMMYIRAVDHAKFKADLAGFIARSVAKP